MALPCGTTGSLCSSFLPVRLVGLTVKRPYAITLYARLPSVLISPLGSSVTLLEATTPVKQPTPQCPPKYEVSNQISKGWYFNDDYSTPSDAASMSPTYPTHQLPNLNVKL